MNWDDMRVFLAVARSGSLSGGARQLGLQHSTVSRRMHRLEGSLGVRLFDKMPSGYELTEAGESLKAAALDMEAGMLEVDGMLSGQDLKPAGSLRVTAVDNMATTFLMPIFASFQRRYPEVEVHVLVSNHNASLAEREADVAIRLTNNPPENLVGKRLATVASCIYGSEAYLQELQAKNIQPEWLAVECCGFHRRWTEESAGGCISPLHVDDTLVTQAALRQGLGVSVLPCFLGDSDPQLARLGAPNPDWNLGLWVLLHPDLKRTHRVLAWRQHLIESLAECDELLAGKCPVERLMLE